MDLIEGIKTYPRRDGMGAAKKIGLWEMDLIEGIKTDFFLLSLLLDRAIVMRNGPDRRD